MTIALNQHSGPHIPFVGGLYDQLDPKSHANFASIAAANFKGRDATIVLVLSFSTLTIPVTLAWITLDLATTAIYSYQAATWIINEVVLLFFPMGFIPFVQSNAGFDISGAAYAIGLISKLIASLLCVTTTLTPSVGKMVFSTFAQEDVPYAGLVVNFFTAFDAVTDWPKASALAWAMLVPALSVISVNHVFQNLILYPSAFASTFFCSVLLEVICLTMWLFNYHLYQNSKVSRRS